MKRIKFTEDALFENEGYQKGTTYKKGSTHDFEDHFAERWLRRNVAIEVILRRPLSGSKAEAIPPSLPAPTAVDPDLLPLAEPDDQSAVAAADGAPAAEHASDLPALDRMNLTAMQAQAAAEGVTFAEGATKAVIRTAIEAARGASAQD